MTTSGRLETFTRAFWVALIPGAALFVAMQAVLYARADMIGADSHAYWMAVRLPSTWYTSPPGYRDAFLYSPAFAQVLWPLGQLPWPAFQAAWVAGQAAVLAWLLVPCGWVRGLTLAALFTPDLLLGNVYVFFAGVLVLSLGRAPGAIALPALTKISPAVVLSVWFAVRRQWRALFWAAAFTSVVVGVSACLDPSAWYDWYHFLTQTAAQGGHLVPRLVLALGVTVLAAMTGRAWLLAPATMLAMPLLGGFVPFAVLAAIPRLLQLEGSSAVPARSPARPTGNRSGTPTTVR